MVTDTCRLKSTEINKINIRLILYALRGTFESPEYGIKRGLEQQY